MRVVAYVPDLMDRSKVAAAAPDATFVQRPDALAAAAAAAAADLVVVDLGRPGVLEALPQLRTRTVGFASHVARDLMEAARGAGCDDVLRRSEFFARLPELLGGPT